MNTLREFDYDLWTTDENGVKKYWVKVKRTGEITEVSHDVMLILRNEEKNRRREIERQNEYGYVLSLDIVPDSDDIDAPWWLFDESMDVEAEVFHSLLRNEFENSLTEKQRNVYECCMLSNESLHEYAVRNSLCYATVQSLQNGIRKKYKKVFM